MCRQMYAVVVSKTENKSRAFPSARQQASGAEARAREEVRHVPCPSPYLPCAAHLSPGDRLPHSTGTWAQPAILPTWYNGTSLVPDTSSRKFRRVAKCLCAKICLARLKVYGCLFVVCLFVLLYGGVFCLLICLCIVDAVPMGARRGCWTPRDWY